MLICCRHQVRVFNILDASIIDAGPVAQQLYLFPVRHVLVSILGRQYRSDKQEILSAMTQIALYFIFSFQLVHHSEYLNNVLYICRDCET